MGGWGGGGGVEREEIGHKDHPHVSRYQNVSMREQGAWGRGGGRADVNTRQGRLGQYVA